MPETTIVTATPFEESKTISLGEVTDFTINLSHAQRWVCTMTGDGTLTVTQPVKQVDQEVTLLISCTDPRVLTLPADSYNAAGVLLTVTILPDDTVGAGGFVLHGTTTATGFFWDDGAVAAGSIPDTALTSKIVKDIGAPGVATLSLYGDFPVDDENKIILGGQTYTFRAVPSITPALDILPGGVGPPWTGPESITATELAINANADSEFDALDVGGTAIAFVERAVGGVALATTTTIAPASGLFSSATSMGFETAAVVSRSSGIYRVQANDVIAWFEAYEVVIGGIASTTQPTRFTLQARGSYDPTVDAAYFTIATLRTRIAQFNAGYWALLVQDPGAVLSADDGLVYEIEI